MSKQVNQTLDYVPQPRQQALHAAKAQQILYGGAAGGGKSHSLRWDAYLACWENPGCDAYLFRCSRSELENTHIKQIPRELHPLMGEYSRTRNRFEFSNGSFLNMCYLEHPGDAEKYNSCEMHWLGFDEASHAEPYDLAYLQSRLRLGGWKPTKDADYFPRCIFASNPGGPSHNYLKEKFIDAGPPEITTYDKAKATASNPLGWSTLYIPAKMTDNSFIDLSTYEGAFGDLPEWQRRRLVDGDWDVVEGAYFDCWSPRLNVIHPFKVPDYWTKYMALDWGHATPFCVLWVAVSDGSPLDDGRHFPDGSLIVYREWYGGRLGKNKGLRMDAESVGKEILEREEGEKISFRVGDPSAWASDGGPSPAECLGRAKVFMQKADNEREAGSQQMYSRIVGTDGVPMLYVFSGCRAIQATVPSVMADDRHPEEYRKGGEDHALDTLRYAVMARPWIKRKPEVKQTGVRLPTFEEVAHMGWMREQKALGPARIIRL